MDNFLGKYTLPKFALLDFKRSISIKEIEKIIKELYHKKEQSQGSFPEWAYQTVKDNSNAFYIIPEHWELGKTSYFHSWCKTQ